MASFEITSNSEDITLQSIKSEIEDMQLDVNLQLQEDSIKVSGKSISEFEKITKKLSEIGLSKELNFKNFKTAVCEF